MGMIGFDLASEESALPIDPTAWFTVTCVFAIVGFVLLLYCFTGCKERIATTPEKPVTYGEMFAEFKANKCLQLVLSIFVTVFLASFISAPVNAYYTHLAEYQQLHRMLFWCSLASFLPPCSSSLEPLSISILSPMNDSTR
jgi:GPH family glycoside/pentoside/hexuronide:cation symporter